mmetsp:Transcript_4901/g.15558  ORF Transcript_4901/g.15558 Transcript_4901/m.15558 type:complete len:217 (-) Transcript_4901:285-935(-)
MGVLRGRRVLRREHLCRAAAGPGRQRGRQRRGQDRLHPRPRKRGAPARWRRRVPARRHCKQPAPDLRPSAVEHDGGQGPRRGQPALLPRRLLAPPAAHPPGHAPEEHHQEPGRDAHPVRSLPAPTARRIHTLLQPHVRARPKGRPARVHPQQVRAVQTRLRRCAQASRDAPAGAQGPPVGAQNSQQRRGRAARPGRQLCLECDDQGLHSDAQKVQG